VEELVHLIKKLGVQATFVKKNVLEIDPSTLAKNRVDLLHASQIRVSFMLFAPLLHKFGRCLIPNPGGCRLGERPIGRVVKGMRKLGVSVEYNSATGYYEALMDMPPHGTYEFTKSSHTGTELLIMLAALGGRKTVITNAALEPEIDALIEFLNEAGAQIKRAGKKITVTGVDSLTQKKPFTIPSDRNEAVTWAILGIASGGDITVEGIESGSIDTFVTALKKAGGGASKIAPDTMRFWHKEALKPLNIQTMPHPGFMNDWQPMWAVLMLTAPGVSIIHERVFENRFAYVKELRKLGAEIEFITPDIKDKDPKKFYFFNYDLRRRHIQAIKIHGAHGLHGGVLKIEDLRAGASLVLASLIAQGESIVTGASILERGYEDFVEKVSGVRGQIVKV
jgi:UDP-N-acetylglucosamine 1-carboxyvinyltransferase